MKEQLSKQNVTISEIKTKLSTSECSCKASNSIPILLPQLLHDTPVGSKKRKLSASAESFKPIDSPSSDSTQTKSVAKHHNASVLNLPSVASATTPKPVEDKSSFASQAGALLDNRPWNLARALKNKKVTSVTGKNMSTSLKVVKPEVKDFWDLSVMRLSPETTGDLLKTTLQSHHIEVKDVSVFDSRIKGCKLANVRISIEHRDKAKHEEIWPEFVRVHDWVYKPRKAKDSVA